MPYVLSIMNDLLIDSNQIKLIVSAVVSPHLTGESFQLKKRDFYIDITGYEEEEELINKVRNHIKSAVASEYGVLETNVTIQIR